MKHMIENEIPFSQQRYIEYCYHKTSLFALAVFALLTLCFHRDIIITIINSSYRCFLLHKGGSDRPQ